MEIVVDNVLSYVNGTKDEYRALDKLLAVEVKNAFWIKQHTPQFDGMWHAFNRLRGSFPTGLIGRVRKGFPLAKIHDRRVKPRIIMQPKPDMLKTITLADFQLDAITAALHHGRGVLALAVNSGKSACATAISLCVAGRTLWLVHRKDLMYQSAEMYEQYTGQKPARFGDHIYEDITTRAVTIAIVQAINLALDGQKNMLEGFSTLILDEGHALGPPKRFYKVAQFCPAYVRIAMSGTPWNPKDPERNLKLEATTGPEIAKIKSSKLIEIGWSARPTMFYHDGFGGARSFGPWAEARRTVIEDCPNRNRIVLAVARKAAEEGKACLIMCDTIRHCRMICDHLVELNLDAKLVTGQHKGKDRVEVRQNFRAGIVPIVVSSPTWDAGISIENIRILVIAAGGESAQRYLQRVGRGMRIMKNKTAVEIHDFVDGGSKHTLKHTISRIKTARDEGFEIVEVDHSKETANA